MIRDMLGKVARETGKRDNGREEWQVRCGWDEGCEGSCERLEG